MWEVLTCEQSNCWLFNVHLWTNCRISCFAFWLKRKEASETVSWSINLCISDDVWWRAISPGVAERGSCCWLSVWPMEFKLSLAHTCLPVAPPGTSTSWSELRPPKSSVRRSGMALNGECLFVLQLHSVTSSSGPRLSVLQVMGKLVSSVGNSVTNVLWITE